MDRKKITSRKLKKQKSLVVKPVYVGLDLSLSSTGYAILSKDKTISIVGTVSSSPSDPIESRIFQIWNSILTEVIFPNSDNIKYLAIEDIAFAAKGQRIAQLSGLHYFIRTMLSYSFPDLKKEIISPSTVKKYVTGKGNAKKNLMLLGCYKKFGFSTESDDICDAYCLARYIMDNNP